MIESMAGVILAGGKSSRFGSNKALADIKGQMMIRGITERLAPLFAERLLVTNTPEEYSFLNWPMTGDIIPESGPLAGIHAALSTIKSPRAFITACDMPLLKPDLIHYLCAQEDDWDAVLPWLAQGPEPLYAVYSKSALPVIDEQLRAGQRKITLIFEKLKVKKIGEQEILSQLNNLNTFHNINRLADLETLYAMQEMKD